MVELVDIKTPQGEAINDAAMALLQRTGDLARALQDPGERPAITNAEAFAYGMMGVVRAAHLTFGDLEDVDEDIAYAQLIGFVMLQVRGLKDTETRVAWLQRMGELSLTICDLAAEGSA